MKSVNGKKSHNLIMNFAFRQLTFEEQDKITNYINLKNEMKVSSNKSFLEIVASISDHQRLRQDDIIGQAINLLNVAIYQHENLDIQHVRHNWQEL
jgi:hypothetical protein